jgi:hypothetical protein
MFDWLIIGAQTTTRQAGGIVPAYAPPFEDVAYIVAQAREAGCKVWLKANLPGETNSQSPGMILPQEILSLGRHQTLSDFSRADEHAAGQSKVWLMSRARSGRAVSHDA